MFTRSDLHNLSISALLPTNPASWHNQRGGKGKSNNCRDICLASLMSRSGVDRSSPSEMSHVLLAALGCTMHVSINDRRFSRLMKLRKLSIDRKGNGTPK